MDFTKKLEDAEFSREDTPLDIQFHKNSKRTISVRDGQAVLIEWVADCSPRQAVGVLWRHSAEGVQSHGTISRRKQCGLQHICLSAGAANLTVKHPLAVVEAASPVAEVAVFANTILYLK